MTRKDSIIKMRDLLVTRRNALRKALAGDLSLLRQLREQTGGDVVDAALDAAQDEISSQLAEVESRELANIERALVRMKTGTYGECEGLQWQDSAGPAQRPALRHQLHRMPAGGRNRAAAAAGQAAIGAACSTPASPTSTCRSATWRPSKSVRWRPIDGSARRLISTA